MAGNYGMADPASVMGAAPSYASAVTSLSGGVTPAQPGGTPANVDQRDWLGNPIRTGGIEFVDGKGYRRRKGEDANGNPIYQDLTAAERQSNGGQYSWDRESAELDRRRTEAARTELAERDALRRRDENAYRDRRDAIEDQRYNDTREDTNNLRRDQITLSRDQMDLTRSENAATRKQQSDHFLAGIDQQNKLLEANDRTNNRRLDIEDRHFQQKLAYDNKMSRRAQIISSLSLVAQSLSRL